MGIHNYTFTPPKGGWPDFKKKPVIAIIPAREESKGIPNKNLVYLNGRPLIDWTILQALQSQHISKVYVTTDGEQIANRALLLGAEVIMRPKELAQDNSITEDAVNHVLDNIDYEPSLVVLLQPTSPIKRPGDIDFAIEHLLDNEFDSVFSATPIFPYVWRVGNGNPVRVQDDYEEPRAMRQDKLPLLQENGAIYVTKTKYYRKNNNRLGGKVGYYRMPPHMSVEIDNRIDLGQAAFLMSYLAQEERDETRNQKSSKPN